MTLVHAVNHVTLESLPENWSIILHAFAFRGAMREARIDDRISGSLGLKP